MFFECISAFDASRLICQNGKETPNQQSDWVYLGMRQRCFSPVTCTSFSSSPGVFSLCVAALCASVYFFIFFNQMCELCVWLPAPRQTALHHGSAIFTPLLLFSTMWEFLLAVVDADAFWGLRAAGGGAPGWTSISSPYLEQQEHSDSTLPPFYNFIVMQRSAMEKITLIG